MLLTIPIAHDFICPWCWVGLIQARKLQSEFGVQFDWRGYELYPDALPWPESSKPYDRPTNKPSIPSRFELMLAAEGTSLPRVDRPKRIRTHNAHEAVEYAKVEGVEDDLIEALYRAYWEHGVDINSPDILPRLAKGIVQNLDLMMDAIVTRRYAKNIVGFDDDAYALGIYNVPTFFIGGERFAEQPYHVLREAVQQHMDDGEIQSLYTNLQFPFAPPERPYTYINMVTSIDGKILSGDRNEHVLDLGSKADHKAMKRIERTADAVLIGAQTLRASPKDWNPHPSVRIVVSRSGNLPWDSSFLSSGTACIATTGSATLSAPTSVRVLRAGSQSLDFPMLLERLRTAMGVQRLLVLGGSETNAQLLGQDLVDELFWTIAPKVKLGRDVPTYADGEPLPRERLTRFHLVEQHTVDDEIFLRYRRERTKY